MGWLTLTKTESERASRMQLEDILSYMLQFGKPRVGYVSNGWFCKVEMNTNTKGTNFEISSEFGHSTPLAAAKECHERIISTIKTFKS